MATIIDGKLIAEKIRARLKTEAQDFTKKYKRLIGLTVILVGDNPASQIYVKNKIAACEQVGIKSLVYRMDANTTEQQLVKLIDELNTDKNIDGILVQLPLPKHLDEHRILGNINPKKDVDGFHAVNAGALFLGQDCLPACTPAGCIELIKSTGVNMTGLHAVVVGRSNIVGKPAAILLLQENCTVTIAHSKTRNLGLLTKQADILVSAVGRKHFITGDMIKPGAIVIDVGTNRDNDNKLYGDVNFDEASKTAGFLTPVPGGVGPMTITMLLANTIKAALKLSDFGD